MGRDLHFGQLSIWQTETDTETETETETPRLYSIFCSWMEFHLTIVGGKRCATRSGKITKGFLLSSIPIYWSTWVVSFEAIKQEILEG